jgi:KaiC/GvpD/RAD55 family RecA-like ATPase
MIADSRWFVACDGCNYDFTLEESSTRDFTLPVYDFGGGVLLPLLRERHWCLDCNTVEWVEVIPSEARIQAEIERYGKEVENFTSGKHTGIGKSLVRHYQSVISYRNRWSKWATTRDQGRCLRCGCQKTVSLDLSKLTKEGEDLGLAHPGCGGRLLGKTEVLDYHANPRRWNGEDSLDIVRFTSEGFPEGNLRKQAEEEYPEISPGLFAVVASEVKAVLTSGRRKRQGAPVRGEDDFPELFKSVRAFVRAEIAGEVMPRYNEESLSYEFPELYGMFCLDARRIIAAAKAEARATPPGEAKKSRLVGGWANPMRRNPFAVLGATVRDDRRKIVELADEKSLTADPDECGRARSDLTNPSKRLSAEVSWLPGLSPKQAEKLVSALETDVDFVRSEAFLPSMACANLMAAAIETLAPETDSDLWFEWLEELAYASQEIRAEDVLREINEDRAVSGFPQVKSVYLVEAEIAERRRKYAETVRNALERLDTDAMISVVTKLAEATTQSGEVHAPQMVHDVIERYEIEAMRFLDPEAENIKKLIDAVLTDATKGELAVRPLVGRLESMLKRWDSVAQPVQLSKKAQGLNHALSAELAWDIRHLSVDLFNKHGLLDTATRLNGLLRETFAELPEVVDRLGEDSDALDKFHEQRRDAKKRDAEWAREITFSAELGIIFKDRLEISPRGVSWKGDTIPLDEVTRVRWGAVRKSVNGIPSSTDHTIAVGDSRREFVIETSKGDVADAFTERLWKAVCVRILNESLVRLKEGGKLAFGIVTVEDEGIHLRKKSFLSSEAAYRRWNQVSYYSSNGSLFVVDKDDQKVAGSMSFMEVPNVHVLEAIIRLSFKKWRGRLSGLLDD